MARCILRQLFSLILGLIVASLVIFAMIETSAADLRRI